MKLPPGCPWMPTRATGSALATILGTGSGPVRTGTGSRWMVVHRIGMVLAGRVRVPALEMASLPTVSPAQARAGPARTPAHATDFPPAVYPARAPAARVRPPRISPSQARMAPVRGGGLAQV